MAEAENGVLSYLRRGLLVEVGSHQGHQKNRECELGAEDPCVGGARVSETRIQHCSSDVQAISTGRYSS